MITASVLEYMKLTPPTRLEGRIQCTSSRVSPQRLFGATCIPVGMPFFLMCTAMIRRQPLQSVKYVERTGEVPEITVTDRLHVKRVNVASIVLQHGFEIDDRLVKLFIDDFCLDSRQVG